MSDVFKALADPTRRAIASGVRFTQPRTPMGPVVTAVLDDTCGNLIQTAAPTRPPADANDLRSLAPQPTAA